MVNQRLLDYINRQLQQDISQEDIKNTLLADGWKKGDIEEAFNLTNSPKQPVSDNVPEIISPPSNIFSVKTPKKTLAIIISIILGIIIVGGVAWGYFYYFQSPEKIVQKMTEKMAEIEIKSLEYSGQITAEIETNNIASIFPLENSNLQQPKKESSSIKRKDKFLINFNGISDLHDSSNPKTTFKFDINTDILPQALELETRTIKNIGYFKLNNVPDLGFFNLSPLKAQWIKIDPETIKKQFGLTKNEIPNSEAQTEQKLSPPRIKQLTEIALRTKVFKITEELTNEKINDINTYHYKFTINNKGLGKLITEINKEIQNKPLTEKELQKLNESLQAIETSQGEIWIGKKNLLLYKILLDLRIKKTEKTKAKSKITISIQFKNYNKPVQIDTPTSVKTIKEIIDELLGGGLQNFEQNFQLPDQELPTETIDFNKDSDNDGLADELEKIYGTDPNNPDTDGDGFKDGEEIENGYNPTGLGKLF